MNDQQIIIEFLTQHQQSIMTSCWNMVCLSLTIGAAAFVVACLLLFATKKVFAGKPLSYVDQIEQRLLIAPVAMMLICMVVSPLVMVESWFGFWHYGNVMKRVQESSAPLSMTMCGTLPHQDVRITCIRMPESVVVDGISCQSDSWTCSLMIPWDEAVRMVRDHPTISMQMGHELQRENNS